MFQFSIVINKLCSFLEVTKWWRFYQWALNDYVKLWISLSLSLPLPPRNREFIVQQLSFDENRKIDHNSITKLSFISGSKGFSLLTLLWASWILVKSHLGHVHVGVAISPFICMFWCRICKCLDEKCPS